VLPKRKNNNADGEQKETFVWKTMHPLKR